MAYFVSNLGFYFSHLECYISLKQVFNIVFRSLKFGLYFLGSKIPFGKHNCIPKFRVQNVKPIKYLSNFRIHNKNLYSKFQSLEVLQIIQFKRNNKSCILYSSVIFEIERFMDVHVKIVEVQKEIAITYLIFCSKSWAFIIGFFICCNSHHQLLECYISLKQVFSFVLQNLKFEMYFLSSKIAFGKRNCILKFRVVMYFQTHKIPFKFQNS